MLNRTRPKALNRVQFSQHLNASWLSYTFILHVGKAGCDWVSLFVRYWEEVEKLLNSGLASMSTLRRICSKKA